MEENLKLEKELSYFFDQSPYAQWISDESGTLIKLNQACRDLLGVSEEEVVGKYNLLKDDIVERQGFLPLVRSVFERGEKVAFTLEYDTATLEQIKLKNKTFRILEVTIRPVKDSSGKVINAIIQHVDITARKQAEKQLLQYGDIVSRMQTGVYIYHLEDRGDDRSLRLINANPASTTLLLLQKEQVMGKLIDEVFPNLRTLGIPAKFAEVVKSNKSIVISEVLYNDRNVKNSWFSIKAFPLPGDCLCVLFENITYRKQAEIKLLQAQERIAISNKEWEKTFNSMSDGVALLSPDWEILNINEPFCAMLGKRREDLVGKKCFDAVHGREAPLPGCPCYDVKETKNKQEVEIFEENLKQWLAVSVSPALDEKGEISYLIHVVRNITERKLMEDDLKSREQELGAIINGLPIPKFVIGADHRVRFWNKALEELSGIKAGEIIGTDQQWKAFYKEPRPCLADLLVDEAYELIPKLYGDKYSKSTLIKDAYEAVDFFPMASSHGRWLNFSAVAIRDRKGKITGAEETLQDITDRKEAQDKLAASEEQYRSLVDNLNVGIYRNTLKDEGRFIQSNPAMAKIFGYDSVEEFKKVKGVLLYQDLEDRKRYMEDIIKKGAVRNKEIRLKNKNGNLIWGSVSSQAHRDENGDIDWIDGVIEDITDRKMMEDRLVAGQKKLSLLANLLENSSQPFGVGYPDGSMGIFNEAFSKLVGYEKEEIAAVNWTRNLTPEKWTKFESEKLEELRRTGCPVRYEKEYIRKDGSIVPIELLVQLEKDEAGQPKYYYSFVTDISERKKIEEALRESEAKLKALFNNISSGVVVYEAVDNGADFIIKDFNKSAERIEQVKKEEVIERRVTDVFPGVRDFGILDVFKKVWNTGIPEFMPIKLYKDQRVVGWKENYVYKLPSNEIVAVYDDVTERKKAEEERNRIFDLSIDLLAVAGFDGYFKQVNPSWTRILGWTREEMLSKPWLEFVHPDDVQKTIEMGEKLRLSQPVHAFENRYKKKDGSYCWLSWNSFPYPEQEIIIAVARDVTEEKKSQNALKISEQRFRQLNLELEDRVRQRTAELEMSLKELDSFSHTVSHDFQTPLRAIDGYSHVILEDNFAQLDDKGREQFLKISGNIKKMGQLIDDLMKFSRLGRTDLNCTGIDMNKLAREAWESFKDACSGRDIDFRIRDLPGAYGDVALIGEVLANIFSNALKFTRTREKAIIEVGSENLDNEVVYYIRDNGVGFDMNFVDKLFQEFVRLHSNSEFEGTGIGLSIVQRIILRHGGKVWAQSTPDKGTTIYFTLPKRSYSSP